MGSPTDVVHPVGRAEASVACRFSRAVSTFAHRLPNASPSIYREYPPTYIGKRMFFLLRVSPKLATISCPSRH